MSKNLRVSAAFLAGFLLLSATPAQATLLSTLISGGGTIQVGDKLFSHFTGTLTPSTSGGGTTTPLDLTGINVSGITQGGLFGLQFTGGINANALGAGSSANIDLLIGYQVDVLDPNFLISDIHLDFNGNCTLIPSAGPGTCIINTTETVKNIGGTVIGQATVLAIDPPPFSILSQDINLTQQVATVLVQKDINLQAFGFALANVSFVDQLVSQHRIPSPATLLLLGAGLVAAGVVGRKKRSR